MAGSDKCDRDDCRESADLAFFWGVGTGFFIALVSGWDWFGLVRP